MAGPVAKGSGKRFSKHVLQVISMVSTHPAWVGTQQATHAVRLREQVRVGTAGSLMGQGGSRDIFNKKANTNITGRLKRVI